MIITTDTTVNAPQSILQMSISWYSGWEIGIEDPFGGYEENGLRDAPSGSHPEESCGGEADVSPTFADRVARPHARDGRDVASDGTLITRQHWEELCSRLLSVSEDAVSDEDLLALLLSYLRSAVNSRQVAMQLITRFETFGSVVSARSEQINGVAEVEPEIINFLKVVRAAGTRLAREEISGRPVLDDWNKLVNYLRTAMAHQMVEQFRVLFLDRRNVLIADEVQHQGTIDHTPVYPREVAKRALALDASAIIMVHNHPSNHPAPSKADIEMTRVIRETVEKLGIVLHDHIISRRGHTSFRAMGLLDRMTS